MAETVASEKTLKLLVKIKKDQWKAMGETVVGMKDLVDAGGLESILGGALDDLKETFSLQVEEALAPLKNEINEFVNEALEPIMPLIKDVLNEATVYIKISIGTWKAIFTGKWDEVFKDISNVMSDDMKHMKNDFNQWMYDLNKRLVDWLKAIGKGWEKFWRSMGWK